MLTRNDPDRIQVAFDDHRLVANAGLVLPVTLAHHLGLGELVDNHVDLGDAPGRANAGDKLLNDPPPTRTAPKARLTSCRRIHSKHHRFKRGNKFTPDNPHNTRPPYTLPQHPQQPTPSLINALLAR